MRLGLSFVFPLMFLVHLLRGSLGETVLFGIASVFFIFSTFQSYSYFKKAKNKKFVEIKVNVKKIIRKRTLLAIISFVIALVPLYFLVSGYQSSNVLNDPVFWLIIFLMFGIISFLKIYRLKKFSKK